MLEKELQSVGLSDKEARVYLAALELGQASAQQIANKSNVNRATTYVAIDSLTKIGMMSSLYQGKKQFFAATRPDRLLELTEIERANIDSKKTRLQRILPQLHSIHNRRSSKPVVRFYEGKEGVKAMAEEFFDEGQGVVPMAYSLDNVRNLLSNDEHGIFREKRIKKNIKTRAIYTSLDERLESTADGQRRWVPRKKFPISADISVINNQVRMTSMGKKVGAVVVEDEEIAESVRALLDLAWEAAEKYDKE